MAEDAALRPPEAPSTGQPDTIDWSTTGLVSIFVRDRIGHEPFLAGATQRSAVQVYDPSEERTLRSRFAEQIRRNERLGYNVEVLSGPAFQCFACLTVEEVFQRRRGAYSMTKTLRLAHPCDEENPGIESSV